MTTFPNVTPYEISLRIAVCAWILLLGQAITGPLANEHGSENPNAHGNPTLLGAIACIKTGDFSSGEEILASLCPGTMDDAIRGTQEERVPCMLIICMESEARKLRTPDRNSLLYWTAADAALRHGDPEVAKAIYEVAIDRYPSDPANWYWLGIAERDLGHIQESAVALRKSLSLKPNDRDASYWLATNLIDEEKYDEADKILLSLMQQDEKDGRSWYRRGELLVRQGKCFEARAVLEKAQNLGVDPKKVREMMSECQGKEGNEKDE